MIVESQAVGPFFKNGFVVGCEETREAVLIDPGDEVQSLLAFAERHSLAIRQILLTHAHVDHVTGVAAATRARLREELHGSHLDDLTRAFRRETEWHALNLEIDRSRRGDGRFVLAFLDIDDLKGINDRAGHAAGDLVLRTLVATLRSSLRSFDPIVRFGGDEFVCGIGGADIREVEGRLAGTQRSLYADTGASFSVGLAVLAAGETLEQLTTRADAALLDAKASRPD